MSGKLTRYNAGRIASRMGGYGAYAVRNNRYVYAARTARAAYQSGLPQALGRAVARGYRGVKRQQLRRTVRRDPLQKIGMHPDEAATTPVMSLNITETALPTLILTRTLYQVNALRINKQSANDELKYRDKDITLVKGLKFIFNLTNQGQRPIYFNLAVVSPKNETGTVTTNRFFRSNDIDNRAANFDNNRTSIEFHHDGINTDIFDVIKHHRRIIRPAGHGTDGRKGGDYDSSGSSYQVIKQYVPIHRKFAYGGSATLPSGRSLYVIYWCDFWGNPAVSTPESALAVENQITIFHTDQSHCC